jgi:hypothetical protein
MGIRVLLPAAPDGVRQKVIRRYDREGVVEVDVDQTGVAAEHDAGVTPLEEMARQLVFGQLSLRPVLQNRLLASEGSDLKPPSVILEDSL